MELNESEKQLYEELFQTCDLAKSTKIPKIVAGELFSSSGLPIDVSLQIADLCGASRLGYFGRSQFYIALKYISAAQQQLPLKPELFGSLPLPSINPEHLKFKLDKLMNDLNIDPSAIGALLEQPQAAPAVPPTMAAMMAGGVLPPPPTKRHVRNVSGTIQTNATLQPNHLQNVSSSMLPSNSQTQPAVLSTQNTAQNNDAGQSLVTQKNPRSPGDSVGWASFPSPTKEQPQPENPPPPSNTVSRSHSISKDTTVSEDQIDFPSRKSFTFDSCSLSSADYATSEASESMDDMWCINDEQREYYISQFRTMQQDLTSTIKGTVAKQFFEKSKLPTNELSVIWKLSDVNRDGALTLQEFCTAMHLVVLRRNEVELPATLPQSLMPYVPASSEPFAADLGDELPHKSPSPVPVLSVAAGATWPADTAAAGTKKIWTGGQSSNDQWPATSEQWQATGASDANSSPLQPQWTGSSHSPTSQPVNFDSAPVIGDSDIAHPVAMKMSPSSHSKMLDDVSRPRTSTEPGSYTLPGNATNAVVVTRERAGSEVRSTNSQPLPARPRPTPKKVQSMGAPLMDQQLLLIDPPPPQSLQGYQSLPGMPGAPQNPPTVPPRNQWSLSSPDAELSSTQPINSVHMASVSNNDPFSTTGENFADFSTKFGEPTNEPFGADLMQGPSPNPQYAEMQPVLAPTISANRPQVPHQFSIRDKREIQNSIRKQRERNSILVRSSSELHSELQEVVEQRISLEIQLEHLKPC